MGGPLEGGPAGAEGMNPTYVATARLLTQIAPVVFESGRFALKGGTAINLFLRDMPRLSVDLDLVFTDHRIPRAEALRVIGEALRTARERLAKRGLKVHAISAADTSEAKLLVQRDDLSVTVEVIYGGKLVAAMDRQHPRDLFDIMELFAHAGGITPAIRRAFVVYLASHNRTLHEVLFPPRKDIQLAYEGSFAGMTNQPVKLDALLETRERLCRELPAALDPNEREFLRTLVRARPDWSLLDIRHLEELPAIRWRLQNLEQVSRSQPSRFRALATALDERLGA
jgi:nucleotidyltransferase AbiEii toxin of type IV toxin-antitoxin system